jgi:hypothetical protein
MFLEGFELFEGVAHRGVIPVDERHWSSPRIRLWKLASVWTRQGASARRSVARALIRSRSTSSNGIRPGRSTPDRRLGCIDLGVQQVDRIGRVSSRRSGPKSPRSAVGNRTAWIRRYASPTRCHSRSPSSPRPATAANVSPGTNSTRTAPVSSAAYSRGAPTSWTARNRARGPGLEAGSGH